LSRNFDRDHPMLGIDDAPDCSVPNEESRWEK